MIAVSFLMGLVPPLRVFWNVTLALALALGAYVWMLLSIKHRSTTDPRGRARGASPGMARPRSPRGT